MDPLKRLVEKIEDVPEPLRELYVANGSGGYRLNAEPDDGGELKRTLERVKGEHQTMRERLSAFEGLDPAEARKALEALREKGARKGDEDAALREVQEKFQKQLEREQSLRQAMLTRATESRVAAAVAAAKGARELLVPVILPRLKVEVGEDGSVVEKVLNERGEARLSPKPNSTDPMTLEELVEELRAHAVYGRAFEANTGSGGGASRSGPGGAGLKRSAMTTKDKTEFIKQHGQDAFLALPQ